MSHTLVPSCPKMNKNASLRRPRDLRVHVRDKTHEQRKPKKRRKNITKECGNTIILLNMKLKKVMQPRSEDNSCKYVSPITQPTIICYPLPRADYSNPLLPPDDMSYPTQVSGQQGSDEYAFSSGRSLSFIHERTAAGAIASRFDESRNELPCEGRNTSSEHTEQRLGKKVIKPPRHPEFTEYDKRLRTFARWYKQKPDPTALCNAGFFFTSKTL